MTTQTDGLLDIPSFLRRESSSSKATRIPARSIVMPKPKKVKRATNAQVKALIALGYNPNTAKSKRREDAESIIRFRVPPTPKPVQLSGEA